MPQQKAILDDRLRSIPFYGSQYDFIKRLLGSLDRACKSIELMQAREKILLRIVSDLDLFHNRETRTYLRTPQNDLRTGVEYKSHDFNLIHLERYDIASLDEILESFRGNR